MSHLLTATLPADDQALRLRDHVDDAFWRFVDGLPLPLRHMGRLQETYSGQPSPEPFAGVSTLNAVIVGAPWLFWDLFNVLPDEQLLAIAEAGSYLGVAYVLLDHLVDGQSAEPVMAAKLSRAFYEQALTLFQGLFDPGTPFWGQHNRLWAELRQALVDEWQLQRKARSVSQAEFRQWAEIKAAPVIITVAALAQASSLLDLFPAAEASLREGGAAAQLDHDIGDWSNDIANQHLTYFLVEVMTAGQLGPGWPTEVEVAAVIDAGWLDAQYFKLAQEWFVESLRLGARLDCPSWTNFLESCLARVTLNLDRQKLRHILRVSEKAFRS